MREENTPIFSFDEEEIASLTSSPAVNNQVMDDEFSYKENEEALYDLIDLALVDYKSDLGLSVTRNSSKATNIRNHNNQTLDTNNRFSISPCETNVNSTSNNTIINNCEVKQLSSSMPTFSQFPMVTIQPCESYHNQSIPINNAGIYGNVNINNNNMNNMNNNMNNYFDNHALSTNTVSPFAGYPSFSNVAIASPNYYCYLGVSPPVTNFIPEPKMDSNHLSSGVERQRSNSFSSTNSAISGNSEGSNNTNNNSPQKRRTRSKSPRQYQFHTYNDNGKQQGNSPPVMQTNSSVNIINTETRKRSQSDTSVLFSPPPVVDKKKKTTVKTPTLNNSNNMSFSPTSGSSSSSNNHTPHIQFHHQDNMSNASSSNDNKSSLTVEQQQIMFSKKNYMPQYVIRHNLYDEFQFKKSNPKQKYYKFFANQ
ncbi:hypothetical protein ABK040_012011 [Willaertia magna]